jgi:hypothetical protein
MIKIIELMPTGELNTEINLRTHDSSVSIIPPMGILFD